GPARFLAQAYGARVRLVHVIAPLPDLAMLAVEGIALYDEERRTAEAPGQARARLDEVVRSELAELLQVEAVAVFGSPFHDLPRVAQSFEADLIVMATHGWTGLKHVLLGSVAERTVQQAHCPVLTVRPPDPAPAGG
ncbi:MAG: universal stress protein, partial [Thermoanaerobaculia bacterium]